jgi:hypothetical protein
MTPIPLQEYQEAMRESICPICVCFEAEVNNPNRCIYENSGQCSLFTHLDEVVETVSGVHSESIGAYTDALRAKVCSTCDHQNAKGNCNLRDSRAPLPTWCILDAYFNLIVGAVEEVQRTHTN